MGKHVRAPTGHRCGLSQIRLRFELDKLLVTLEVVNVQYSIEMVDLVLERLGKQPIRSEVEGT